MAGDVIDVSISVGTGTPVWPGTPALETTRRLAIERGDDANATLLTMDVHCGTHVDAPLHFIDGGADLESVGLDPFVGPAFVAHVGAARRIGADELDACDIPPETERLLLRTSSSGGWADRPFDPDFPALTLDGARWVADRGLLLVGIDYVSIQRFDEGPEVHRVLLGAGVCILEGTDLADVDQGRYDLVCLPVRLAGVEAAPARVILRRRR